MVGLKEKAIENLFVSNIYFLFKKHTETAVNRVSQCLENYVWQIYSNLVFERRMQIFFKPTFQPVYVERKGNRKFQSGKDCVKRILKFD